jgi:hypothetical protein
VVGRGVSLICQGYNLPVCHPFCHTQTGPSARRLDPTDLRLPHATQQPHHTPSSPSPRGGRGFLPPMRRPKRARHVPRVVGWMMAGCVGLPVWWGGNRTPPGRFADVNWGSRPSDFRVVKEGGGEEPEVWDGWEWWGGGRNERIIPTGCWGCLATTRVSDNVVVAVADIFLFISSRGLPPR